MILPSMTSVRLHLVGSWRLKCLRPPSFFINSPRRFFSPVAMCAPRDRLSDRLNPRILMWSMAVISLCSPSGLTVLIDGRAPFVRHSFWGTMISIIVVFDSFIESLFVVRNFLIVCSDSTILIWLRSLEFDLETIEVSSAKLGRRPQSWQFGGKSFE